jgi:hypothetical protein
MGGFSFNPSVSRSGAATLRPAAQVWRTLPFGLFVRDQLVEPAHLPLAGLQPQPVQLAGVAIDLLLGPGQRRPQALAALFDAAAAALEDAHPHVGRGPREERQVDAEAFVVPGLRPGVAEQLPEALLALRGELVDPPSAPRPRPVVVLVQLFDQVPGPQQLPQGRVQRAVRERAERAERLVQPLAQHVPVHGRFVQKTEDRELQHTAPPSGNKPSRPALLRNERSPRSNLLSHYIAPIHRSGEANEAAHSGVSEIDRRVIERPACPGRAGRRSR